MAPLTLFKQKVVSFTKQMYYPIIAILMALFIGGIIINILGFDALAAYRGLLSGSLGSLNAVSETLIKAIPLVFTALSYAIAKRCGLINLGAEGQLYIGALFATIVGTNFSGLPSPLHIILTLVAGFLGGALYGFIVGAIKIRFGASELITTIMLNYVAVNIISFCVTGPIKDMENSSYPQSVQVLKSAQLPRILEGTRLHAGLFIALIGILLYYLFLWHTAKGYEMRVVGLNPSAGQYAGMNLKKNSMLSMFLAGGFAGLGGCIEIIAVQLRLIQNFSANYGFDGIAVALLGGNNPIGIGVSSVLFGVLRSGANKMQMLTNVPTAVIYMIQGMIIIFVVGRELFNLNKKRNVKKAKAQAVKEEAIA
ncbi:ABC transporter permease [Cellulosilyticum sp. I15G10I2]|uniref:ABC transporter permease n=1 Tax=Cellulosilyticum sp. I15G10I2 TaxID=1892843 RepID=UPI00085CCA67|nr:ABC transporter permease [Cellulosilyticum sp. I15G10I2]